jgi:hypothetical protein
MSSTADWFAPTSSVGSTRLYMAGASVGAVIVLVLSVAMGWSIVSGASAAADPASIVANAAVGSCLTWTRSDESDLGQVDCGQPHVFEVTGSADVSGAYPAGAPFPNLATWQQIVKNDCAANATGYIGTLDPNGKYVVSALKPTAQQWSSGNRTLRCGLQSATPSGAAMPTTGTAKGQDQSAVYPAGVCLALVNGGPGGPVSCTDQHAYEIVGTVDLGGYFPGGYPAIADQQTKLAQLCQPVLSGYDGNANLGAYQLTLTWDTIQQASWAAGSHKVNCKVGSLSQDGGGLAPVTGSIKGIGSAGGAATTGGG